VSVVSRPAATALLAALWALGPGCTREAPPAAEAPAAAAGPALTYRAELRLELEDPDRPWLRTEVELELVPRGGPLGRFDLGPGLYDQGVRPEAAPDAWEWSLVSLESDRPIRLEATDWTLGIVPARPPGPGDPWRLSLGYWSPVGILAQGLEPSALLPAPDSAEGALRAMLELGEKVLARFAKDAPTASFAEDGVHVLVPPWPLPHDCAGRSAAEAFPPLECVSRHQLPVEVRVHVPPGWQAVLPTPPRWEDDPDGGRVAVVDRLPALLLLAPRLAWRELEVGGRAVRLCAPEARAADLDELARLVGRALPRLEARLGPYPQAAPIVCLSPTPIDLWGLARGRLALVDVEAFSAAGLGARPEEGLGARLEAWIAEDAYFRALREELVLHELAHHWWRAELPDRWERLLGEGAATFIARELLLEGAADERTRFFARASPWLDAAQLELAGARLPPRAAYLARGPVPPGPGEALLPYLHGLQLLEGLYLEPGGAVRWEALRALHAGAPAVAREPASLLADPAERARLRALLAEDAPLQASARVDPVEHALACTEGMLAALEGDPSLGPLFQPLRRSLPALGAALRAQVAERIAAASGLDRQDWALPAEVLAAAGVARCAANPLPLELHAGCLEALGGAGLGHLAGLMARADPEVGRAAATLPRAEELLDRPRPARALRAAAEALADRPVALDDAEAARLADGGALGEARAALLRARLAARWAARAALALLPLAAPPSAGQTPVTAPAR